MIDFGATLYDPIYTTLGVTATISGALSADVEVTALDKTAGVPISIDGNPEVQTIRPAATVRMSELTEKGVTRAELDGATIEMNAATWRIEATLPRPSPQGEGDGELWLILIDNG